MQCPCCSGELYNACCQPLHEGKAAPNALALMRSRYSAYALKKPSYIMATTHPKNPSFTLDLQKWQQQILFFCQNTQFERLEVVDFSDGMQTATVTFIAHLKAGHKDVTFKEKSLFEKVEGRWLYKEGKVG